MFADRDALDAAWMRVVVGRMVHGFFLSHCSRISLLLDAVDPNVVFRERVLRA
jgi:hypothetical protein